MVHVNKWGFTLPHHDFFSASFEVLLSGNAAVTVNHYALVQWGNQMTSYRMQEGPSPDSPGEATVKERRGRRMEISCRLFFFGEDEFEGEATLLDISTNGCRASSAIDVRPGMVLKLSLFLPDHKWPLRIDQAIVRWAKNQEFGVEFTSIRLAQRERLRALLMKAKV